ncbi:MAG TPA: DUF1232 domain-containing protein [Symbiobacteriaceae bacterium]|jgi:uncharacterized membrane protein YkvA (DUF1232 family)
MTFGPFLQAELNQRHWTYSDLAVRTGCHVSLISRVARGQRQPTVNVIRRCAEALALPLARCMAAAGLLDEAVAAAGTPEAAALSPYVQYAATADGVEEIETRLPDKLAKVRQLEDPSGKVAVLLDWVDSLWVWFKSGNGAARALAGGALLYFLSPVDLVPDFIPLAGLLDDLSVVALVVGVLSATQVDSHRQA